MAFREVSSQIEYPLSKTSGVKAGDVVVDGFYVGPVKGRLATEYHFRQRDTKKIVGLNGGHIRYLLEKEAVEPGRLVRVTYLGKDAVKKGRWSGSDCHSFKLEIDDDVVDEQTAGIARRAGESEEAAPVEPPKRAAPEVQAPAGQDFGL